MSTNRNDINNISIRDLLSFTDAHGIPRQEVANLLDVSLSELQQHAQGARKFITRYVAVEDSDNPLAVDRIDDEEGTLITLHRDFYDDGPECVFLGLTPENARLLGEALIRAVDANGNPLLEEGG